MPEAGLQRKLAAYKIDQRPGCSPAITRIQPMAEAKVELLCESDSETLIDQPPIVTVYGGEPEGRIRGTP